MFVYYYKTKKVIYKFCLIALKLVHVDMYIHRLRERARRKRVGRDYQLVSNFFNSGSKKDKCFNKKKFMTNLFYLSVVQTCKLIIEFRTVEKFHFLIHHL